MNKRERNYYIKQKVIAIIMLLMTTLPIWVEKDATAFVCMSSFWIWMLVTKEKILNIDGYEYEEERHS